MVRKSTNMQLLYKRLLFVLGMSCNVTLNYSFVSRNCPPVPFPAGTQLYLDARIKTVVSKKVKQGFELALETIDVRKIFFFFFFFFFFFAFSPSFF